MNSNPLQFSDLKVGTKVRIVAPGKYCGKVGTIAVINKDSDGNVDYWYVYDANANKIGGMWRYLDSFELFSEPKAVKSQPLTKADMKPGTKVICVFKEEVRGISCLGEIGYIDTVNFDKLSYLDSYTVKKADGSYIGTERGWSYIDSFELVLEEYEEEAPQYQMIETVSPPIVEAVRDIPCPAYYYGVSHCTCGRCSLPFHMRQ